MPACRRNFQCAFHIFLAFDLGKIVFVVGLMLEQFCQVHFGRRNFDLTFQELRGLAEILHRNYI